MVRSYTTSGLPLTQVLRNGLYQFKAVRGLRGRARQVVAADFKMSAEFITAAEQLLERAIKDLQVLEVGHGPLPRLLSYISMLGNVAVGIDTDVFPSSLCDITGYIHCLRRNGPVRVLKTLARELSGVNRSYRREFLRLHQLTKWPPIQLLERDAISTSFRDAQFDLIFSFNVFEHLANPREVIVELKRILKPGGGLMLSFPHYAHPNALHDLRYNTRAPHAPPPWAHLVPDETCLVQQGAYVNTIRLAEWQALFLETCPGARFRYTISTDPVLLDRLQLCRARGLLQDFSDDELLMQHLHVEYRKPK